MLRALGHQAVWERANDKWIMPDRGYNVVVEGFVPEGVAVIADGHRRGARFICLATEEPTPRGFNHGTQREMVMRQENFHLVAPYLDAIFHLVPGEHVTSWYSQHAPSAYVELGYAPTLVRPDQVREPRYDFGFYGSVSKRRLRILKNLANRTGKPHVIRVLSEFPSQDERDAAMQDCKVILQIRKFDEMGLVSSSRCCTSLCLGRPVVAEPHLLSHPWDEVVQFAKNDEDFYNLALMTRGAWRGVHAGQMAKFKNRLSPAFCVGEALAKVGVGAGVRQKAA